LFDTFKGLTKPIKYDYSTNVPVYHMNNKQVIKEWKSRQTSDNSSTWCYCSLEDIKKIL
jgi:hypothetical protein